MNPKQIAFIKNIRSGNRDTLNKRVYELISSGVDIMPKLEIFTRLKYSTLSARINDLESSGLIIALGVKVHNDTMYTRYKPTPEGEEKHYIEIYNKRILKKRYDSLISIEDDKERRFELNKMRESLNV